MFICEYFKKENMAIIPEAFRNSVVALGIDDKDGKRAWVGTGFLVGRKEEKTDDKSTVSDCNVVSPDKASQVQVLSLKMLIQGHEASVICK